MATAQPLFYSQPVPLDAQKHANVALRPGLNLNFAAGTHAVPLNMIEFAQACHHYPIVFSPDVSATPVAVLGLKEGENLYVTKNGDWAEPGAYIPSYIRRYPFLLASIAGTDQLTLCVDEQVAVPKDRSPLPFFDEGGKPSAMTGNALEYCKSFHAATLQTQEFCKALQEAGLLEAREAEIPTPSGQKIRFGGFRIIDEKKFAELPDATFTEWRKKGWVAAVYAVLFAAPQWTRLARMQAERTGAKAA